MISALLLLAATLTQSDDLFPTGPREWEPLEGNWTVDLSTDPQVIYNQPMVIDVADNGQVTGSFYNTPISSGRYGSSFGRQCIAFVTSDGAGDYQHSACLVDGRMVGQSWAEHRGFLLPWAAERATAP